MVRGWREGVERRHRPFLKGTEMRGLIVAGAIAIGAGVAFAGDHESVKLLPGDPAPAIDVTNWIQGEAVSGFDADHVYVLDFWATWCGPCIKAMPHLTSLQEKYGDKVTVIAVNIWEKDGLSSDDRLGIVRAKVKQLGEKMGVRVAVDGKEIMTDSWMEAAGARGIPTTFIVDGSTVAWIGSPYEMDETLEEVVEGTFDVAESRASYKAVKEKEAAEQAKLAKIQDALAAGDGAAFAAATKANWDFVSEHPGLLNMVAWEMATNEAFEERDLDLAKKASKLSCEMTEWKDAAVLDTYARVLFEMGNVDGAIKYQRKAVEALGDDTDPRMSAGIREALERYENELVPG